MTTLSPGTIVTPQGDPSEHIVGIVLDTDYDGLQVVWFSALRGVFVSDETPGDVDVAAKDWRRWYDTGDSIEPTALAEAIVALVDRSLHPLHLTEKELRLAWLAAEVQVDGNGDDADVRSLDAKITTAVAKLPSADPDIIDMDLVAAAVRARGMACIVEQTGGGCATIFAGGLLGERYAVAAGPGWFEGPNWTLARASRQDFSIGPDDGGESTPFVVTDETHGQIADLIIIAVDNARSVAIDNARRVTGACILTGEDGENADDCTTHDHETVAVDSWDALPPEARASWLRGMRFNDGTVATPPEPQIGV